MPSAWVDFKGIKEWLTMDRVLADYGIRLRQVGRDYLRGRCPLPTHSSTNSIDSFSVDLSRNIWSCHSQSCTEARAGRIGGNVIDFVAEMERCSVHEAGLRIQERFGHRRIDIGERISARPRAIPPPNNQALMFELHNVDAHDPYLQSRGISPDTARTFGVGIYNGNGFLRGRVVIPVHDEHSRLVAYAGRSVTDESPKYRFPQGFKKSQVLFNLNRVSSTAAKTVIVVEGFFDALKVYQAGHPAVVALMGSSLSQKQQDLLTARFDRVLLMLDGDQVGQAATQKIAGQLRMVTPVSILKLRVGTQPDQLESAEINRIVGGYSHEIYGYSF